MPEDIVWKYSWSFLVMLLASIPQHEEDEEKKNEEPIEATADSASELNALLKKNNLL